MASVVDLDVLMRQGWPAQTEVSVDGWVVRLSGGVTRRANSVLPLTAPADLRATLDRVELLYRERGIAPCVQLGPTARPGGLDAVLAARGYQVGARASVQTAGIEDVLRELARLEPGSSAKMTSAGVEVSERPDRAWMDLWWAVDGRGDAEAREVGRRILTGRPALYASWHDAAGATAIGRLALVGDWGGLYCLAVRPDCRRQGRAMLIIDALLDQARARGLRQTWLQVTTANQGARALYARLGFRTAADYHYRTLVPGNQSKG